MAARKRKKAAKVKIVYRTRPAKKRRVRRKKSLLDRLLG